MPDAKTTIKALATVTVFPGIYYVLMGLGIAPIEDKIEQMAAPFIEPLGIPTKPFFCFLGPCKILGGLSLWGIGPMPEIVGRLGLMLAASCGAYGHSVVGESPVPPIVYAGMIASLFLLDKSTSKGKKA
eukprot:CAMPEP_0116136482 /NCGR_PEP_ID=MMETSP0329-20121206/11746_1 /TAXON_ID=697910 /ORGANISM="Pseudo-nitzschia arenysensis, Strain B593" /LENGTH=128 /DNA_ID=CAMNT_0003631349 /DNA_START=87 /DNA_END=473 /DNA_ORIENTATION=+